MITGVSPNTIVELERLLKSLEAEREAIQKRLHTDLDEVERRIAAIETVLGSVTVTAGDTAAPVAAKRPATGMAATIQALRGLKHFQALVKLAEMKSDHTVRPTDAAHIFKNIGLSKGSTKNMVPHLYRMLRESPRFEKVAPGTFRLKPEREESVTGVVTGISTINASIAAAADDTVRSLGTLRFPIRRDVSKENLSSIWASAVEATRARAAESKKPNTDR